MSLDAHLAELTEKHRSLERRLAEEMSRPVADVDRVAKLKFEKLKLKDQIARLSQTRH